MLDVYKPRKNSLIAGYIGARPGRKVPLTSTSSHPGHYFQGGMGHVRPSFFCEAALFHMFPFERHSEDSEGISAQVTFSRTGTGSARRTSATCFISALMLWSPRWGHFIARYNEK